MILNHAPFHTVTVHTEHKIKRKRNLKVCIVSITKEPEDKTNKMYLRGIGCSIIRKFRLVTFERYKYRDVKLMNFSYG
jgi:hypothetical protein